MAKVNITKVLLAVALLALGAASLAQHRALQRLQAQFATLQPVAVEVVRQGDSSQMRVTDIPVRPADGTAGQRLARLEQAVEDLLRASDHLMERGAIPLNEAKSQALQARFYDSSLSNNERIQALRLLRRNGALTDEILTASLNWMQSSTNANLRRDLLQQMEGSTNPVIKQPLLAMLENEASDNVREEAVERLRAFSTDPAVEDKLWQLAVSDPEGDVRNEAMEALTEGKLSDSRVTAFKTLATDPHASADERVAALEALRRARVESPEVIAKVAELAMNATDPGEKAQMFGALEGVRDESVKVPLVSGLQDPNPSVRGQAADSLSTLAADPIINQWLEHLSQNDPDANVRREALQSLNEQNRRDRGGRGRGGR